MDLPKSLKRVLAISGIATGLSGVSLMAQENRQGSLEKPDAVVDVAKLPIKYDPQTGEYRKLITPVMMEAADKVCHMKHLFAADQVTVEATNVSPGNSTLISVSCIEAHHKGHPRPRGR